MADIPVLANLDLGGAARLRGLQAPVLPGDAATKAYADGLVGGTSLGRAVALGLNLPLY